MARNSCRSCCRVWLVTDTEVIYFCPHCQSRKGRLCWITPGDRERALQSQQAHQEHCRREISRGRPVRRVR